MTMSDAYGIVARLHTETASTTTEYVHVENVGMTFKTKRGPFVALRDIDLSVQKGEFIALIGHSGCGKTTLLNLIAGLLKPTTGMLLCAGREIAGPGPDRGVVFPEVRLR